MDADALLSRGKHTTHQVVDDVTCLIHMKTGCYFTLNKVGTEFWDLLDGTTSIANHAAHIAQQHGVERERVLQDLVELAQKMVEDDLVDLA